MEEFLSTSNFTLATYAKGNPAARRVALVLPGRLDTKDYPHMQSHVDHLASEGFYAVSFDPPGTWDSPGGIGLYTMTTYLAAINELIEAFGNKPTILVGHSRGGSMAMLAGTTNPKITHFVAIMSSPVASIPQHEATKSEISYRDDPHNPNIRRVFELPRSYFEDAARFDMRDGLANSSKPKLFFLGLQDVLIGPEEVRDTYTNAAQPKRLIELSSSHDYRRNPDVIKEVNVEITRFLKDF